MTSSHQQPEPPRPTDPMSVVDSINHALNDYDLGPDAMRWTTDADTLPDPNPPRMGWALVFDNRPLLVVATIDTTRFVTAMRDLQRTLATTRERITRNLAPFIDRLYHDLQHQHGTTRCRRCNPTGNPPPLTIDGHAYHRRQRRRTHR